MTAGIDLLAQVIARKNASSGGNYFTDNVSGVDHGWSLSRKLDGSYSGDIIRIRRSEDDEEADVAFDGDTWSLDSAVSNFSTSSSATTVGEFVAAGGYSNPDSLAGANDAFIRTVYNQVGSGDIEQSVNGEQPEVISSGAINADGNSNIYCTLDGTDDVLDVPISFNAPMTYLFVAQLVSGLNRSMNGWNSVFGIDGWTGVLASRYYDSGQGITSVGSVGDAGSKFLFAFRNDDSDNYARFNNGTEASNSDATPATESNGAIGGRTQTGGEANADFYEYIIFNEDASSQETNWQNDINAFYSIW